MKRLAAILAAFTATAVSLLGLTTPAHAASKYVLVTVNIKDRVGGVGAAVNLWNVDTGQRYKIPVGGTSGSYFVLWSTDIPAGRYTVTASNKPNYPAQWWPGAFSSAAAGIVRLAPSSSSVNCATITTGCNDLRWDVDLVEAGAVTGYVRNRNNTAVANAKVTAALAVEPVTKFTATTNSSGYFTMSVPQGGYTFSTPNGNTTLERYYSVGTATPVNLTLNAVPSAPRNVSAAAASKQLSVVWTPPADSGGKAITSYRATASPGGQTCTAADTTSCTITGLTNGTTYTVTVTATNAVGTSAKSAASNKATPVDPAPSSPREVQAVAGPGQATVSWAPPSNGNVVTGYRVTSTPGGHSCTTTDLSCTVTGLANGTSYTFAVTAASSGGSSPAAASNPVTPADVPGAPQNVTATAGSRSLTATWVAPSDDGGLAITGYTATADPGGRQCTAGPSQDSCTITGLTSGRPYTVTVTATNAVGDSAGSSPSNEVTPLDPVPSAPTAVSAVAGPGQATVSWKAPDEEAASVTGYRVVSTPGGHSCTTTDLSCTVTGLANGTSYTFVVTASSSGGESPASAESNPAVPADVPGAPQNVTATAGTRSAIIKWNAPTDDGGAAVIGYTATANPGGRQCTAEPGQRTCTITGLTEGPYTVTVTATNAVGDSAGSSPSNEVTPLDPVPSAPTAVSATAGPGQATVSWDAPTQDADTVTGYRVVSSPGGYTCTTKDLSCTITGLANGTAYTFAVKAVSNGGMSPATSSAPVTPADVPSAPRNVQASPGARSLSVTWNAPADNGGAAVTEYTATAWPGGRQCTAIAPTRECAIGGLTNGTAYTVTVTATNAAGVSERSPGSAQVTPDASLEPKNAAPKVTLAKVSAAKGKVRLRWKTAGARSAKVTWHRYPKGKRTTRALAASKGRMILKGKPGQRYRVVLRAVAKSGKKAKKVKVYRIPRR